MIALCDGVGGRRGALVDMALEAAQPALVDMVVAVLGLVAALVDMVVVGTTRLLGLVAVLGLAAVLVDIALVRRSMRMINFSWTPNLDFD